MFEKKRVTLQDISLEANVSLNTVAKVLAGKSRQARISDKTAENVRKIARQCGYVPNLLARNLRSIKSSTIGVYISDMMDSVPAEISHRVLEQLHKNNFYPIITVAETGIKCCMDIWLQNRIQGLVLCGTTREMDLAFFKHLQANSIDSVIVGCAYQYPNEDQNRVPQVSCISVNNFAGIEMALNHLWQQGRKKIAFFPGPSWHADNNQRLHAYLSLVNQHQAPVIAKCDSKAYSWHRGYLLAEALVNEEPDIDGICAYDDQIAIGAMKYLAESSIIVPDDIAVVGFDNSPQAEYTIPSLTSIMQPTSALAEKCVAVLLDNLGESSPVQSIQIMPEIVVRESSTKRKILNLSKG